MADTEEKAGGKRKASVKDRLRLWGRNPGADLLEHGSTEIILDSGKTIQITMVNENDDEGDHDDSKKNQSSKSTKNSLTDSPSARGSKLKSMPSTKDKKEESVPPTTPKTSSGLIRDRVSRWGKQKPNDDSEQSAPSSALPDKKETTAENGMKSSSSVGGASVQDRLKSWGKGQSSETTPQGTDAKPTTAKPKSARSDVGGGRSKCNDNNSQTDSKKKETLTSRVTSFFKTGKSSGVPEQDNKRLKDTTNGDGPNGLGHKQPVSPGGTYLQERMKEFQAAAMASPTNRAKGVPSKVMAPALPLYQKQQQQQSKGQVTSIVPTIFGGPSAASAVRCDADMSDDVSVLTVDTFPPSSTSKIPRPIKSHGSGLADHDILKKKNQITQTKTNPKEAKWATMTRAQSERHYAEKKAVDPIIGDSVQDRLKQWAKDPQPSAGTSPLSPTDDDNASVATAVTSTSIYSRRVPHTVKKSKAAAFSPKEEADRRRDARETYQLPLTKHGLEDAEEQREMSEFLFQFSKQWKAQGKEGQRMLLLKRNPDTMKVYFKELVRSGNPEDRITDRDFWERYYYRCDEDRILREFRRNERKQALLISKRIQSKLIYDDAGEVVGEEQDISGDEKDDDVPVGLSDEKKQQAEKPKVAPRTSVIKVVIEAPSLEGIEDEDDGDNESQGAKEDFKPKVAPRTSVIKVVIEAPSAEGIEDDEGDDNESQGAMEDLHEDIDASKATSGQQEVTPEQGEKVIEETHRSDDHETHDKRPALVEENEMESAESHAIMKDVPTETEPSNESANANASDDSKESNMNDEVEEKNLDADEDATEIALDKPSEIAKHEDTAIDVDESSVECTTNTTARPTSQIGSNQHRLTQSTPEAGDINPNDGQLPSNDAELVSKDEDDDKVVVQEDALPTDAKVSGDLVSSNETPTEVAATASNEEEQSKSKIEKETKHDDKDVAECKQDESAHDTLAVSGTSDTEHSQIKEAEANTSEKEYAPANDVEDEVGKQGNEVFESIEEVEDKAERATEIKQPEQTQKSAANVEVGGIVSDDGHHPEPETNDEQKDEGNDNNDCTPTESKASEVAEPLAVKTLKSDIKVEQESENPLQAHASNATSNVVPNTSSKDKEMTGARDHSESLLTETDTLAKQSDEGPSEAKTDNNEKSQSEPDGDEATPENPDKDSHNKSMPEENTGKTDKKRRGSKAKGEKKVDRSKDAKESESGPPTAKQSDEGLSTSEHKPVEESSAKTATDGQEATEGTSDKDHVNETMADVTIASVDETVEAKSVVPVGEENKSDDAKEQPLQDASKAEEDTAVATNDSIGQSDATDTTISGKQNENENENVQTVVQSGEPKSIENDDKETGRADAKVGKDDTLTEPEPEPANDVAKREDDNGEGDKTGAVDADTATCDSDEPSSTNESKPTENAEATSDVQADAKSEPEPQAEAESTVKSMSKAEDNLKSEDVSKDVHEVYDVDKEKQSNDKAEKVATVDAESKHVEAPVETKQPETKEAEIKDVEAKAADTKDTESNDAEINKSDTQKVETDEPNTMVPKNEDTKTGKAENREPETKQPDSMQAQPEHPQATDAGDTEEAVENQRKSTDDATVSPEKGDDMGTSETSPDKALAQSATPKVDDNKGDDADVDASSDTATTSEAVEAGVETPKSADAGSNDVATSVKPDEVDAAKATDDVAASSSQAQEAEVPASEKNSDVKKDDAASSQAVVESNSHQKDNGPDQISDEPPATTDESKQKEEPATETSERSGQDESTPDGQATSGATAVDASDDTEVSDSAGADCSGDPSKSNETETDGIDGEGKKGSLKGKKKVSKNKVDPAVSSPDASGKDEDDTGKVKPSSKKKLKLKKGVVSKEEVTEDVAAVQVEEETKSEDPKDKSKKGKKDKTKKAATTKEKTKKKAKDESPETLKQGEEDVSGVADPSMNEKPDNTSQAGSDEELKDTTQGDLKADTSEIEQKSNEGPTLAGEQTVDAKENVADRKEKKKKKAKELEKVSKDKGANGVEHADGKADGPEKNVHEEQAGTITNAEKADEEVGHKERKKKKAKETDAHEASENHAKSKKKKSTKSKGEDGKDQADETNISTEEQSKENQSLEAKAEQLISKEKKKKKLKENEPVEAGEITTKHKKKKGKDDHHEAPVSAKEKGETPKKKKKHADSKEETGNGEKKKDKPENQPSEKSSVDTPIKKEKSKPKKELPESSPAEPNDEEEKAIKKSAKKPKKKEKDEGEHHEAEKHAKVKKSDDEHLPVEKKVKKKTKKMEDSASDPASTDAAKLEAKKVKKKKKV